MGSSLAKLEYDRRWKKEHPEQCREYSLRYRAKFHDQSTAWQREWKKSNLDKCRASGAVYRNLKKGILIKSKMCEMCGNHPSAHGHHADYQKPLEVMWLCERCHYKIHVDVNSI
jgi:ribosomal protein S27AE